jgi:hypothetical protein
MEVITELQKFASPAEVCYYKCFPFILFVCLIHGICPTYDIKMFLGIPEGK